MATSTGDSLGQKLHEAATNGINMDQSTQDESLMYWKKIANALIDFLANMDGGNPITIKCGSTEFTISSTGITGTSAAVNFN
jgi:hypothetical protein